MVSESCSFPECGRKLKVKGLRLCSAHYGQHLSGKRLRPITKLKKAPDFCTFPLCERKHSARGWCERHWQQDQDGEKLSPIPERIKAICEFDKCERAQKSRGWCKMHYSRWQRLGDPLLVKMIIGDNEARFWSKVSKSETCWVWEGSNNPDGYGSISIFGRQRGAHRFSYELANGPIPEGMEVDHQCHSRSCVKPSHLRLTTRKENMENRSGVNSNNTSGVSGVSRRKGKGAWYAKVSHHGKQIHVGCYGTIAEAEAAVIAKRNELFTHNDRDRIPA